MNVATITSKIKSEVVNEIKVLYKNNWTNNDNLLYKRTNRNDTKPSIFIFWKETSGYLSEVNYKKLSILYNDFLIKHPDLPRPKIYQMPIIGEFIMSETTIAFVLEFEEKIQKNTEIEIEKIFSKIVNNVFLVYKYRNYKQDINFGVRKLVDIAIKAISPAVNDPTTCINCIDHLGEIVRKLSIIKFPSTQSSELRNEKIFINEFDFNELVNFAFDQIYQWGKKDPVIVKRILRTISQILPCVENPYNLMVLIKAVEDMEMGKIYSTDNTKNDHTIEQITSILTDLKEFNKKAVLQIQKIKDEIFTLYGKNSLRDNQGISIHVRTEEKDCILYLQKYLDNYN